MKKANFYILLAITAVGGFFGACNEDNPTPSETGESKYVLMTVSDRNQPNGGGYISAFEKFPTGTFSNVVPGKSLEGNRGMAGWRTYDNWIFKMFRTSDATQGIEKIEIAADGTVTTSQFITSTNGTEAAKRFGTGNFVIDNETSGFYWDGAEPMKIQRFNPTTMSKTGSLDFTSVINERGAGESAIQLRAIGQKLLAIKNGKLFANITYATGTTQQQGQWDDFFPDVYIAVIDVATGAHEKTIKIEDTGSIAYINDNPMYDFDTNGDLYIVCQGRSAAGGKSKIVRIKASETDIDNTWVSNFSDFRAEDNGKFVNVFAKDGRLIVTLNTTSLIAGGPTSNINSEDIWKFYSIDVNAPNTFNAITGIPVGLNPGAAMAVTEVDGKTLLRGATKNSDNNGYYEYNPSTNSATELFKINEGGVATGFTKINLTN